MYNQGFVAEPYVVEAVAQSQFKRQNSARRNYERMVYENIEHGNTEFKEMLDDEIGKIKQFNKPICRDD